MDIKLAISRAFCCKFALQNNSKECWRYASYYETKVSVATGKLHLWKWAFQQLKDGNSWRRPMKVLPESSERVMCDCWSRYDELAKDRNEWLSWPHSNHWPHPKPHPWPKLVYTGYLDLHQQNCWHISIPITTTPHYPKISSCLKLTLSQHLHCTCLQTTQPVCSNAS